MRRFLNILFILALASSCSVLGPISDEASPFTDGNATKGLGKRDLSALQGAGGAGGGKAVSNARHALEVMGSYRRAQAPEPAYPVVKPAEVRLMWVPDHLNRHGDLVTSHYYYLRVLNDRWAVQDAFDLEGQLKNNGSQNGSSGSFGAGGGSSSWVYKEE